MTSKRKKRLRAKLIRRIVLATMLVVIVLGLVGLGLWLLLGEKPEATIEVYPLEFEAQIRRYSAENGLDPAWPAAVILAESSYVPDAVSSANAQGRGDTF